MKKQHLFTLDVDLVKRLHKEVARGFRSKFVNKAITNRLDGLESISLWDYGLMSVLSHLRNAHYDDLTPLENLLLKEIVQRLEALQ